MKFSIPKWVLIFVAGLAVGGTAMFGFGRLTATQARGWEEWAMPARFEGQGAFTLGCAFWDVPQFHPYGEDNPDTDYVEMGVSGESGDVMAVASVDGPQGTAFISGSKCAVSVDWSAFPTRSRPAN